MALLAPVLTLLLPMTLLSGLLMTESAFLPAFLLALYAIVLALERPTCAPGFVLLNGRLATAVRLQGLALVAVPHRDRPRGGLRAHRRAPQRSAPVLLGEAEAVLAHGRLIAAAPSSTSPAAPAYEEVARAEYSVTEAWRMTKLHLADLALVCGFASR